MLNRLILLLSLVVISFTSFSQGVISQGNSNTIYKDIGGRAAIKWFILPTDTTISASSLIDSAGSLASKDNELYLWDTSLKYWTRIAKASEIIDTATLNNYYIHNDTVNLQDAGFKVAQESYAYRMKLGEPLTGFLTNNQNQFHEFIGYDSTDPVHNHSNPLGVDRRGCISTYTRVGWANTATGTKQIRGGLFQASLRDGNDYALPSQQHPSISSIAGQTTIEQGAGGSIDEATTLYLSFTAGTSATVNQSSLADLTYGSTSNVTNCIGIRLAQVTKGSTSNIWNFYTDSDTDIQPVGNWLIYDSSSTTTTLPNYFKGQMRLGNPADLGSNYKVQATGDIIFSKKLHAYDTLKLENIINNPIKIGGNGVNHSTTSFKVVTIGEDDTVSANGGSMLQVSGVLYATSGTPAALNVNTQYNLTGNAGGRTFLSQPGGTMVNGTHRGFLYQPSNFTITGTGSFCGFQANNTTGQGFLQDGSAVNVTNTFAGNTSFGSLTYTNPLNAKVNITGTLRSDSMFTTSLDKYTSDLSANYDARTKIDKGYADATYQPVGSYIDGTMAANVIPKGTDANTLQQSSLSDNGTVVTSSIPITIARNANSVTTLNITNSTNGTGAGTGVFLGNNAGNSSGQIFKVASGYSTYKNISGSDLGTYNSVAGNMSFLNDYASGNINFAAGGASSPHFTIASTGNATFTGTVSVPDAAFSSAWDGSVVVPTRNAIYDMVQASAGNATLASGTIAVANTAITANSIVVCQYKTASGTQGFLTYTLNAGVGFTINSSTGALDNSVVSYYIKY